IQPDEPDETEAAPEDELESEAGEPAGDVELIRDLPTDDELAADVIEALRDSDVPAGDRLAIAAVGGRVTVRGLVESIDVLDELLGIVGDVPGVEEVVDEVAIEGL
ncbi:MAG TPA: BON domain-containing protein, partial [Candidatus Limnocylindria bacterium]|nr:BON domain-containing protein [Candidatus Limnocylindria bacterium]